MFFRTPDIVLVSLLSSPSSHLRFHIILPTISRCKDVSSELGPNIHLRAEINENQQCQPLTTVIGNCPLEALATTT
jgi:hypothetical protein